MHETMTRILSDKKEARKSDKEVKEQMEYANVETRLFLLIWKKVLQFEECDSFYNVRERNSVFLIDWVMCLFSRWQWIVHHE